MAKRIPGRLVALSASAVATIYVAGFLSTQPAAQTVAAQAASSPTLAAVAPLATSTSAPNFVVGATATSVPSAAATATSASSAAVTAQSHYGDGTYAATGTSQLGNVTVSLTVSGDKISSVQITKVTTKFPMSRIASLPAAVVQSQSANVNVISGATYSSQAFKQAVQQALAQAQAARGANALPAQYASSRTGARNHDPLSSPGPAHAERHPAGPVHWPVRAQRPGGRVV